MAEEVKMAEQRKKTVVNSWTEWDPLKHVIVGRADGTVVQTYEPAMQRDFPKMVSLWTLMDPCLRRWR